MAEDLTCLRKVFYPNFKNMSTPTVLLALRLPFFAAGFGMLLNPHFYEKAIKEMIDNEGVFFLGGLLTLVIGFILADYQGTGSWSWVITWFGYLSVLKGLALLAIPEKSISLSRFVMKETKFMRLIAGTILLLGVILLILSFRA
jgi:uncharacterized protein YjeT (DUF2065 family)